MCHTITERYNACRCLYYKHPIDPCSLSGTVGHVVEEKTVLVGFACIEHPTHNNDIVIAPKLRSTPEALLQKEKQTRELFHSTERVEYLIFSDSLALSQAQRRQAVWAHLDTAAPYLGELLNRLLDPQDYIDFAKDLEYEVWYNSATHIYGAKSPRINLAKYILYPDVPPDQSQSLPPTVSDLYITSLCGYDEDLEQSMSECLTQLHNLRECRNVVVKTFINLERLRISHYCTDYFSLIVIDTSRSLVACLKRISFSEVGDLVAKFEFILRAWANLTSVQQSESATMNQMSALIPHTYFARWFKLAFPSEELLLQPFITKIRLLVHILDLAVVSYSGAHVSDFVGGYLQRKDSKVDILEPYFESRNQTPSVSLQRCSLQCLNKFHRNTPVWIFTPGIWKQTVPLYLSTDMETFADVWGPLWKATNPRNPVEFTHYATGNGSILPWRKLDSKLKVFPGEVFCHWISDEDAYDEWEANKPFAHLFHQVPSSLNGSEKLLIGANSDLTTLEINRGCKVSMSTARKKLKDAGRLRMLGTSGPYKYNDGNQYQIQVGYSGINASVSRQYKRIPGQPLKDVLLELWAMEPELRHPLLLEDLYGIEVSLCTQNSQRVPLSSILRLQCMRLHLRGFRWSEPEYQNEFFSTLQDSSREAWKNNCKFRGDFDKAVMVCLKALGKTGVERNGNLSVFLSSKCTPKPELCTFVAKEHSWIGILKDTTTDCTMAALADACLEFRHRIGKKCKESGVSVFKTALIPNESVQELPVIRLKVDGTNNTHAGSWIWRYDTSSLKPKTDIWLGERGILRVVDQLPDGMLLTKWRAHSISSVMKHMVGKERPTREYIEIDHSGEQSIRPIPVFIISD